jgi:hypothetical protein
MIINDLTFGDNNGIKVVTEMQALLQIQSAHINVIKSMLAGTDSDEWLLEANNNVLKNITNG